MAPKKGIKNKTRRSRKARKSLKRKSTGSKISRTTRPKSRRRAKTMYGCGKRCKTKCRGRCVCGG